MEFKVTEIKALGASSGFTIGPESLSLRLEGRGSYSDARCYNLHVVVPYSPEFVAVQVGHKFKLEQVIPVLNQEQKKS